MLHAHGNFARRVIASGVVLAGLMGAGSFAGSLAAVAGEKSFEDQTPADRPRILRGWLKDLSDDEPSVREGALRNMLSLRRPDLAALRAAVKERLPLLPGEEDVLHEVVEHVFLTGADFERQSVGFLGVVFESEQQYMFPESGGVEIRRRLPGFCGYRYLEDGDVVLRVGEPPTVLELQGYGQIQQAVQTYSAGQTITFEVLRGGRLISIPIILDGRPKLPEEAGAIDVFESTRRSEAQDYWEREFAPLLEGTHRSASSE